MDAPPARPLPHSPEEAVVARAASGDRRAFEQLYRLHAARIHALCLRLTGRPAQAEDCTQECFIAAWRALPGFQQRSSFGTWLHRIAVNTVLNERRRGGERLLAASDPLDDEAMDLPAPPDGHGTADVEAALGQLPPGARDVLVLVGLYGHTHEEAAAMLGIAVGTSKAQLHRGRRLLAARLGIDPEAA